MSDGRDETSDIRLERMVAALREAFGERVVEVARRQLERADGEAAATWERIVAELEA